VLIAQAVFLLQCGQTKQTNRQMRINAIHTLAAIQPEWVMMEAGGTRERVNVQRSSGNVDDNKKMT